MGDHLIDGEFQSDKYPSTPRGCVPLKPSDPTAQDLLWEYAQRRRAVDGEFASDLEAALLLKGYCPPSEVGGKSQVADQLKSSVDWKRYPKLAAIFEHRPSCNVYWHELIDLMDNFQVALEDGVADVSGEKPE